jgi:hypothetical protein
VRIGRPLNLVQEFETDSGTIYLHSMPLSVEVWRNYFLVLSKTYSQLFAQGIHTIAGPAIARLMLEQIAKIDGVWEGPAGVQQGLLAEIRRLSNVLAPTGAGWDMIPYETALQRGVIDPEAAEEMEGALVFFICASAVLRGPKAREKLEILLGMLERLWGAQSTSLDITAFRASLPTLTPAEIIGAKMPVSSVPH